MVIKAPSYLKFENVNVMRKKNDKFNIIIHYPCVWYENKVNAKISKQDELTKFLAFQLLDETNSAAYVRTDIILIH